MKALRYKKGVLDVLDIAAPDDRPEPVVRVIKSGICNTDLEIARGYAGFEGTLGHEFVGIVETAAGAPNLAGKRVVGEINAGCGRCKLCVGGDSRHCPSRTVLGIVGRDGAHAEFLQLPARNLIEVPDNVSDDAAVFVEPLASAHGISERVKVTDQTSVAIIGDGKLGLLCAIVLSLKTKDLLLIGKHSEKLAHANMNGRGIEVMKHPTHEKFDKKFDVVVEASGSESGFATALELVRSLGTIVLKSTFHGTPRWAAARIVVDEIAVVGSRCGRFAPALDLLSSGQVRVDDLISEEMRLSDGVAAMTRAAQPGVLKILLSSP